MFSWSPITNAKTCSLYHFGPLVVTGLPLSIKFYIDYFNVDKLTVWVHNTPYIAIHSNAYDWTGECVYTAKFGE